MKFLRNFKIVGLILALSIMLAACSQAPAKEKPATGDKKDGDTKLSGEIYVSAAASLKESMAEITALFTKETGVKVNTNLAGSGALQKQIEEGAPSDVFISAGAKQVKALEEKNLVDKSTVKTLLENELVMIVPNAQKDKIKTVNDLEKVTGKIAVAETKTVPVGQYTLEALTNLKIWDKIESKVVYAKDVKATLAYVEEGNADAGFVYKTDAMTAKNSTIAQVVDPSSHKPVEYPMALVTATKNKDAAVKFMEFLKTKDAVTIFEKYGFKVK